jgi:TPR repeat protein
MINRCDFITSSFVRGARLAQELPSMYQLKAGDDVNLRAYRIDETEELFARAERVFVNGKFHEGIDLFAYLAHLGDPKAQTRLGAIIEAGRLVGKDKKQAKALYEAAAEKDCTEAQLALGRIYQKGSAVAKEGPSARSNAVPHGG